MSEIIQHIGQKAALQLVRHFAGVTIAVPQGKKAWPDEIESVIGREATEKFVQVFCGNDLYIPKRHKTYLLHRNIAICLEYEEELLKSSASKAVNTLARRHGFSDRNIWSILKGTDPAAVTAERKRRRAVQHESATRAPARSVPSKTN
ncbi:hypothetical protein JCM15519_35700 [Fundidesulfovibrio butyratiphilus]